MYTWSSYSIAMADHGNIIWLINGDPKLHSVAKTVKNQVSIIPEFDNDSLILPAPNILQSLGKVPVVESDLTKKEKKLSMRKFQAQLLQKVL